MELEELFGAEPRSTWQVLCEPGTGFYIPAYQRDYTWERDKIDRLIEDSLHGLRNLVENDEAITFLGTLIVIRDTKYQTVEPHDRGNLPKHVLLVIDGQQRLTTLLLLNTCLHEELSRRLTEVQDDTRPAFEWLSNQTTVLIDELDKTFRQDMSHGEALFRHYPRMIRAFMDSWSRKASTAKYASPIAACLHGYSAFITNGGGGKFDYTPPSGIPDDELPNHEFLGRNRKYLRDNLAWIAKAMDEEMEFPRLDQVAAKKTFQETLLKAELPPEVVKQLGPDADGTQKEKDRFNELMRLVLFAKFMMERVAVTVVTAKNEDYAFDMFEALNTTGEPLTAFETFRPKVIEAEKLHKYEGSASQLSMKLVEGYLDQYKGAQAKHDATSDLLVPFALAETGDKLSKRLSDQRGYLRDKFERHKDDLSEQREFVKHLSHTAVFLRQLWPDEKNALPELEGGHFPNSHLALLCLDVLRAAKHHITVGVLTRFYSKFRSSAPSEIGAALKDFQEAILAVTAFFALWRGSRTGTAKIDSYYREVMREGIKDAGVKALSRRPNRGDADEPTAERLRAAFRQVLKDKGKITSKEEWVKLASQLAVYKTSVLLSRFLLYVATHDTAPDPASPGLVKAARPGSLNMLTLERWREDLTVEHVAPQARNSVGWDKALYDDPTDLVNRLGNLALAPGKENASFGDRPWADKRLMYRVLGTPTLDDLAARLDEASRAGIVISRSTEEILKLAGHLPHVCAIAEVSGGWSPDLVKARSERLAELAWDRLAPWLGIT